MVIDYVFYIRMCKYLFGSVVLLTAMEEQLRKLVEHAEPKPSQLLIVSGTGSRLKTTFNPPLMFPKSCPYEMALC